MSVFENELSRLTNINRSHPSLINSLPSKKLSKPVEALFPAKRLASGCQRASHIVGASAVLSPPMNEVARPDAQGRFGKFGGKYVPETLIAALTELEVEFHRALEDRAFKVMSDIQQTLYAGISSAHEKLS